MITDHISQDVEGWVQNAGEMSEQHLPEDFGVAAVSRKITPDEGGQLIGREALQLRIRTSSSSVLKPECLTCSGADTHLRTSVFLQGKVAGNLRGCVQVGQQVRAVGTQEETNMSTYRYLC